MSTRRGRPPPRNDAGGRPLLALLSVVLIVAGIANSDNLVCIPLILLGTLLAILCAFHSRIRGVVITDKIKLPIAAQSEPDDPSEIPLERHREPDSGRLESLREIREAAKNPVTDRRRRY